jgi:hypothetical protein
MRTTRALGATADDGGAAPGAAGSGFAALDSEFGSPPSTMSSCDFGWESAFEPTVESNDPGSPNDAVSEWSPRIPDPQSAPATPPISKKVNAIRNSRSKRGGGQRSPNSG